MSVRFFRQSDPFAEARILEDSFSSLERIEQKKQKQQIEEPSSSKTKTQNFVVRKLQEFSSKMQQLSTTQKIALTLAVGGAIAGAAYYLYSSDSSESETLSKILDGKKFLVIHDNKPKNDAQAGRLLARVGIIDEKNGYTPVKVEGTPLEEAKDLESLIKKNSHEYLTCQSNGKCFEFGLEKDENNNPVTTVLNTFKLNTPKGKYTNIEGVALSKTYAPEIFWSHRGDPNKFDTIPIENQPRTTDVFKGNFDPKVQEYNANVATSIATPFEKVRLELRAAADHIITSDNTHLYVGAADPEETGTTDFGLFSILHNDKGQSIYQLDGDKIEALYLDEKDHTLYLGSDNEGAGARVCKLVMDSLRSMSHKCATILKGQEFGVSGMVAL